MNMNFRHFLGVTYAKNLRESGISSPPLGGLYRYKQNFVLHIYCKIACAKILAGESHCLVFHLKCGHLYLKQDWCLMECAFVFNFKVKKEILNFPLIVLDNHEQINAEIKGAGGAIGIMEYDSTLQRWLVFGPEVSRMINEFQIIVDKSPESIDFKVLLCLSLQ